MPLTVLICAIWLVTCALSIGFSGSWFCICVTSSLRKRSVALVSVVLVVLVVLLVAVLAPPLLPTRSRTLVLDVTAMFVAPFGVGVRRRSAAS